MCMTHHELTEAGVRINKAGKLVCIRGSGTGPCTNTAQRSVFDASTHSRRHEQVAVWDSSVAGV